MSCTHGRDARDTSIEEAFDGGLFHFVLVGPEELAGVYVSQGVDAEVVGAAVFGGFIGDGGKAGGEGVFGLDAGFGGTKFVGIQALFRLEFFIICAIEDEGEFGAELRLPR